MSIGAPALSTAAWAEPEVGDVELDRQPGDLARDLGGALEVQVADGHLGALGGEPPRDRRADPAGAAGDEGLLALRASWRSAAYSGRPVACSPVAEPIPIIGGTGALGYGLAVRWARAGEQIVIGSRKAERAAEAAERVRAGRRDAEVEGLENAEAATRGPIVFLTVPFRAQSETLTNLKRGALSRGRSWSIARSPPLPRSAARPRGRIGVWQGSAAQQAAGDGPRRRHRDLGAPHGQRARARRGRSARRGHPHLRRPQGGQGAGGRAGRARSRACARSTPAPSRWPGSSRR